MPIAKFKKGDVVFCVAKKTGWSHVQSYTGDIATIDENHSVMPWAIKSNGRRFAILQDEWEHYKLPQAQSETLPIRSTPPEKLALLVMRHVLAGLRESDPAHVDICIQNTLVHMLNQAGYTITETTPKVERTWTITPTKEPDTNSD